MGKAGEIVNVRFIDDKLRKKCLLAGMVLNTRINFKEN